MSSGLTLPASLDWLGRPALHAESGLAGHVVVVLLWRLGCDDCREAAAELEQVVRAVGEQPFVVLAAQVPTNAAERDRARQSRAAAARPFAACVDAQRELVGSLQAKALPFVALFAADGERKFASPGVPHRQRLREAIDALLADAAHDGRRGVVPFVPYAEPPRLEPVALLAEPDRLWLAAAGSHRVHELDHTGRVLRTFGSGAAGGNDGVPSHQQFVRPAALLGLPDHVLVADASAHTLRALERRSGCSETWSGTGRRSTDRTGGAYARDQGLCTPSALLALDGTVVIAQPLLRQLWQFDPATRAAAAWLGSGERHARSPEELVFQAPHGLAAPEGSAYGGELLVADAGADAIVAVDLAHLRARVRWAGVPRPVAVLVHEDSVFVAASFGPAILVGSRHEPTAPLRPLFGAEHGLVEPGALAAFGTTLWIADVGADVVWVADLAAPARGLVPLALAGLPAAAAESGSRATLHAPARLAAHGDVALRLRVPVVAGDERFEIDVVDAGPRRLAVPRHAVVVPRNGVGELLLPLDEPGIGALRVRMRSSMGARHVVVPIEAVDGGALVLEVDGTSG
ncbi:MAG: hypothetical protein JNL12_15690 [Planctomycetes bacterium]|nr:hypothetical protein [Planctomycetota bacterium]